MKKNLIISISTILLISLFTVVVGNSLGINKKQRFTLTKKGSSDCKIIIPQNATVIDIQAAKVFQDFIQRISGASIPIKSDNAKREDDEILIGNVNRPELRSISLGKLGEDGFYIENTGENLIITGGNRKGVLYGVYTFLEKYLDCKKYAPGVPPDVPKKETIKLEQFKDIEIPAFTYRDDFYRDVLNDQEYMDWHKLDNIGAPSDQGNKWGSFGHSFHNLLSSKEYGKSHSEYFSYYNGKYHPGYTKSGRPIGQLTLTNPDVLKIVCENLQKEMDLNSKALYWSVSQNDNVDYSRAPGDYKLDTEYATYQAMHKLLGTGNRKYYSIGSGSLIWFVNKVAERFPNKIITTLAYQWTRTPPKGIAPRENVNIELSNIESPRNIPFFIGDTTFTNDLLGWLKLTHNIILWDYVVQFSNLMSPFPNFDVLQPNLQFLHNHGVPMIFSEGNPETGGEFSNLRAYLIAKLLWNPDISVNKVMNDFLSGYYGDASKMIRKYIDLLQNEMDQSGIKLSIYGNPVEERKTFLSDSLMIIYNHLFDQAEKAVSASPKLLQRVKTARLPIDYAMLEIAKNQKIGKDGAFIAVGTNRLKPNPKIVKLLYDFVYGCIQDNVSHIKERRVTPLQYLDSYNKFLENNLVTDRVTASN